MPRSRSPLPAALATGAFTVAQARELGLTRGQLRHASLHRPTRGVWSVDPPVTVLTAARAMAAATGHPFALSHGSAAYLLGWPMSGPWQPGSPIHLMRPTTLPIPRRAGVIGHRGLESRRVVTIAGLPVVAPADTWADLGSHLPLDDLVVVGDFLLGRSVPLDELRRTVAVRAGARGTRRLAEALTLIRPGSASRMETLSRVVFHRTGLPEPQLNADVFDRHGGWLLRADFLWRRQRVIGEYQGDHHRTDRRAWQVGFGRRHLAESHGWRVVEFGSRDIVHPPSREVLIGLLRSLLRDAA